MNVACFNDVAFPLYGVQDLMVKLSIKRKEFPPENILSQPIWMVPITIALVIRCQP